MSGGVVTFTDRSVVTVHVDYDESYPVFFTTSPSPHSTAITMTEQELRRFQRASDEWEAVQEIMRDRAGYTE